MTERIRNLFCGALIALCCFSPGAVAQATILTSSPSVQAGVSSSVPLAMLLFFDHDRGCRHDDRHCRVAAAEGGSPVLYVLLAGATCVGAMLLGFLRKENAGVSL